jgi:hypothetical protein
MTEPFASRRAEALPAALTHLGGEGAGPAEIAGALGWARRRLRATTEARVRLAGRLEQAHDAALAWWEARARSGVAARPNAALWGRAMAGRFAEEGYGRAVERVEPVAPVAPEETVEMMQRRARAVRALLAKLDDEDQAEGAG